jgi:hypothetical protein
MLHIYSWVNGKQEFGPYEYIARLLDARKYETVAGCKRPKFSHYSITIEILATDEPRDCVWSHVDQSWIRNLSVGGMYDTIIKEFDPKNIPLYLNWPTGQKILTDYLKGLVNDKLEYTNTNQPAASH